MFDTLNSAIAWLFHSSSLNRKRCLNLAPSIAMACDNKKCGCHKMVWPPLITNTVKEWKIESASDLLDALTNGITREELERTLGLKKRHGSLPVQTKTPTVSRGDDRDPA